jgi:hypothetical protein
MIVNYDRKVSTVPSDHNLLSYPRLDLARIVIYNSFIVLTTQLHCHYDHELQS